MRSIAKFSTRLSIAGLAVLMGVSAAFANTLSEVQINAQGSGYGIVLKTDEAAQVKKTVSSDNKLTIQLKDVKVSPNLNTVYNNVANLDNVTVAPSGKDDIKIIFTGEGIADSKVYFENVKTNFGSATPAKESISLNAPISSYKPVYNRSTADTEENVQENSSSQLDGTIIAAKNLSKAILGTPAQKSETYPSGSKSSGLNFLTIAGMIFISAALMFRNKKKAPAFVQQQGFSNMAGNALRTPQIDREIALSRRMADNMALTRPDGLGAVNPVNAGYGMRAYQNSQKNPYVSGIESAGVSGISRRKPLRTAARPVQRQTAAPVKKQPVLNRPVAQKNVTAKAPAVLAKKAHTAASTPSDLDSVKFLESITKIYEKNGRTDLAKGLKENLRKAQATHPTGRAF